MKFNLVSIFEYGNDSNFADLYVDFSNPNSNSDRYLQNIIWSPMHTDQFNYLDIDEFPTMKDHLNTDRYFKWEHLFPIDTEIKDEIQEDDIY